MKVRILIFGMILVVVSLVILTSSLILSSGSDDEAIYLSPQPFVKREEIKTEQEQIEIAPLVQPTEIQEPEWNTDQYMLAKIAMAEAEGESIEGKALVMLVVLNRVKSNEFPDTVSEVILQCKGDTYQFTPVKNGRFDRVEPNEDCWKALEMVELGWDESQGALYFEACTTKSTWHSRNLTPLFICGGHQFYK